MELMGVYDEELVEPLAQVMAKLGVDRGMVVYGQDSLDEISMCAPTSVCEIRDGWFQSYELPPEQFGYAQSYFGKALSSLTDTYSHIYGAEDGEVDFADAIMQRCIEVQSHPYKLITYCFYIFIVVQRRPEETQLTACILLFCRYIRGYPFMECPHTARNQPCEMTGIIQ